MTISINHAGLTDIGRVRTENEDHWFADPRQGVYLVADGMGGALGGGLASRVVVETLPVLLEQRMDSVHDLSTTNATEKLTECLVALSTHLCAESRGQQGLDGMGSTVVIVFVRGQQALVGHLGDSRAYRLRDNCLERLTKDHTIVQLLLDSGDLEPEEVADHPARGQLTRFVGMEGNSLPDIRRLDLAVGDRFLLCSDGLTGMLDDNEIAVALASKVVPNSVCQQLINAANREGGKDNITALVMEIGSGSALSET